MPFDYVIYLMLFVAFIFGLYRGIKREITYSISYTVSFLLVFLFLAQYLKSIDFINESIVMIQSFCKVVFDYLKINVYLIEFVLVYIIPFVIVCGLLNLIFKLIFFRKKDYMMEKKNFIQRLCGGLLGTLVGVQATVLILCVLNSFLALDLSGSYSQLIMNYMPSVKEILVEGASLVW